MSNPDYFARWTPLLGHQSRLRLLLGAVPHLITSSDKRLLLRQMRRLDRDLPDLLASPLPEAMEKLVTEIQAPYPATDEEKQIRKIADLAVALNRQPRLGYCLRRSLIRCYFLRRAGLPVVIHFGARIIRGKPDREINGHAWLTLDNNPYFESAENWRDFTIMLSFPQEG